ncbi:hypothetical protein [Actinotalea sp. K2]|uniref:hypothetical protein n=1 Tax=Actinotalea sp. K2 TaxID=2939438 RepID=UPI0020183E64|nr:hypothetical protein [Actinotalea sp. K2]MCL3861185.1 hypothetical protein [Actinotalea sp. K2]
MTQPSARPARTDVYQQAVDAATAHRREIAQKITELEGRIADLRAQEDNLTTLLGLLRELVPDAPGRSGPYLPPKDELDAFALPRRV